MDIQAYGEFFQRSNQQNLPKRRVGFSMWTGSESLVTFVLIKKEDEE